MSASGRADPAKKLVDRMVIEVNSFPFTQRQIEIYLAIKNSLLKNATGTVTLLNQNNWADSIEEFRIDMLIEQESQRLNTFQATPAQIDVAEQFVVKKGKQDAILGQFLKNRAVSRTKMRQVLASILRVRGFILNRLKQSPGSGASIAKDEVLSSKEWIKEMEQRIPFRFFEGSRTWQPLTAGVEGGDGHDRNP